MVISRYQGYVRKTSPVTEEDTRVPGNNPPDYTGEIMPESEKFFKGW
jgi:hypothetical protein